MPIAALDVLHCPLDGINLIEASAGTGKTWTICGLYLRLLLERERTVQQILVVTFTNAATAELRERIRARLVEMSVYPERAPGAGGDRFIPQLAAKLDALGIDCHRRLQLLQRALESFDEASIFTIHGFCQRALADSPFSAGLPMKTELLEDDLDLLMEAVNDFWRRHVASDSVSSDFARYLYARKDSPQNYAKLLRRYLAKPLAKYLWPADIDAPLSAAPLDALYQQVRDTWQRQSGAIIDHLRGSLTELNAVSYNEGFVRAGAAHWTRLCRLNSPYADAGDKSRLYRSSVLATRTKKDCRTPQHVFFDQAEEYCALRERVEASFRLARLDLLRRLFDEAGSQLKELKLSRQVISFNDMLSNVHERLEDPGYPWLAASIKTRFPAALIDEFQDTDPLQFAIFRRIYDGGETQVFVVGDPKQAIYSFRNADLQTYLRARSWATNEWSLVANQRSSEHLLTALNGLFEINGQAFILPGLDGTEPRAPLQLWTLPHDANGPVPKRVAKAAAVQATCAEIARLIGAGARGEITLDEQPLRPRHIAVLVRSRALGNEVKQALAELRVGAVEMSRESVFHSPEAQDLETVLTAVLSPARESLVREALATDLIGCDVAAVERISGDDALLMERIRQFTEYRGTWQQQGFGLMYRRLLADHAVARRMLLRADGERRLTNFLHLGESLHQAAEMHGAPEALLRHLKSVRDDETCTDAAQLRLESDQNLVQIVTIHTCKGLEYPVVFCPFICDGITNFGGPSLEGLEYHGALLEPVIDFRPFAEGDLEQAAIKGIVQMEAAAETVRLLYVALTRAVHRCYLVTGCYLSKASSKESVQSMLNWLVAGRGMAFDDWCKWAATPAAIDAAWRGFALAHPKAVALAPLPSRAGTPLDEGNRDDIAESPPLSLLAAGGWRLSSYSGLSFGATAERAADDRDARVLSASGSRLPSGAQQGEGDVLWFPRGPSAGECIHAVFENIDFADDSTWDGAIAAAMVSHPQTLPGALESVQRARLARMLRTLVKDVTETEVIPGLQLRCVSTRRRLTEMEFTFPVPRLSAGDLNATLRSLGYHMPMLRFAQLQGYLKGFIDLVFEHRGRYFIVDWKSNHLGYDSSDYAGEPLAAAMSEHGYHLQYLLYTIALDRYLASRIPGYRYETHVGGVLYLFVRGVRPEWTARDGARPGVYFHRPDLRAIRTLNGILNGSVPSEIA